MTDERTNVRLPDDTEATRLTDSYRGVSHEEHPFPKIEGYSILSRIDSGGMGVVYRAIQLHMNRTVALKLVHGGATANPRELVRFLGEVEAAASIVHPHVIQVYDSGDAGGQPYLAMELLSGGSLAAMRKPIPPREAASLICKIALATQAAHDRQIIHRDLKPANILFDAQGEPRITDFGLAKRGQSGMTATNAIMGTPSYMAPEQAKGESKYVGPAADIWSLGVILYECLTGAKPFSGSNELEIIRNVVDREPGKLRSVSRSLPKDLESIVLHCLHKEPSARYPTAKALADDLQNWLDGRPISVKETNSVTKLVKWVKRNKLPSAIMTSFLAAAITMTVLAIIAFDQRRLAKKSEVDARNSEQASIRTSRDLAIEKARADEEVVNTRRLLDVMRINEATSAFNRGMVVYARDTLNAVAPENRTSSWYLARRHCEGSDFTLLGHNNSIWASAWSPDGKTIASTSSDSIVHLWNAATGQWRQSINLKAGMLRSLSWSPDGRHLAAGRSQAEGIVLDVAAGRHVVVPIGHTDKIECLQWSPNGKSIATGGGERDKSIRIWDSNEGAKKPKVLSGHTDSVLNISWSPDGKLIASCSSDLSLRIWNVETGLVIKEFRFKTFAASSLAWHPDGRTIAVAFTSGQVNLLDNHSYQWSGSMSGTTGSQQIVQWSPDGRTLAIAGAENTLQLWDAATSKPLRVFVGHTDMVRSIFWSPDGRKIGTGSLDKTIRVWDATHAQSHSEYHKPQAPIKDIYWHPVEPLLAIACEGVQLWNPLSCELKQIIEAREKPVTCLAWSQDGQQLASGGIDHSVRIWDRRTNGINILKGHESTVMKVDWHPTNRWLASCDLGKSVRIWDTSTGGTIKVIEAHSASVYAVAFSPDGKFLATSSVDKTVRIWKISDFSLYQTMQVSIGFAMSIAWDPESKWIVGTCGDKILRVWDIESGKVTMEFQGHTDQIWSVSCSSDGRTIASSSVDRTIRLWDITTGRSLQEIRLPDWAIKVGWDRSGRNLAHVCHDRAVRVWSAPEGQAVQEYRGHKHSIINLRWTPDHTRLVSEALIPSNDSKKTQYETLVWNAKTFERIDDVQYADAELRSDPPQDEYFYIHYGNVIARVNRNIQPVEELRRSRVMSSDPSWHRASVEESKQKQQWYSALFHLKKLILLEPENAALKSQLDEIQTKLSRESR